MASRDLKPIYLFSLPRSGSTLVQRVISQHADVASSAEPWLLLPLLGALDSEILLANYNQRICANAIKDFIEKGDPAGYAQNLRHFILSNYGLHARAGEKCFLDKTPRYHQICEEIIQTFGSEGKYIILWRNPLAVAASIVETFCYSKWNLLRWNIDLYDGVRNLLAVQEQYEDMVHVVNYEDLLTGNSDVWRSMFEYLELDFSETYLVNLSKKTFTGMGDPTGQDKYAKLSDEPLKKWMKSFSNPYRKRWAKKYLSWIGEADLEAMGYDSEKLWQDLNDIDGGMGGLLGDMVYVTRDLVWKLIIPDAQRINWQRRKAGKAGLIWS